MTRCRSSNRSEAIRVLLAENMNLLRTALVAVLSEEDDMEVIADLDCDQRVMSVALRLRPDVAVVAADLPDTHGVYTVAELRRKVPECRVVALTATRPASLINRLLAMNVSGLIDKNAPAVRLLAAIRGVAAGSAEIDPNLVLAGLAKEHNPLTPREVNVLRLAASGATGPQIAQQLSLSPGTVRNYLSNAMTKAGARTRIEAIRIATDAGWL